MEIKSPVSISRSKVVIGIEIEDEACVVMKTSNIYKNNQVIGQIE